MKKGFSKGLKPKPTCGAGVLSSEAFIQMQHEESMRLNRLADAALKAALKGEPSIYCDFTTRSTI